MGLLQITGMKPCTEPPVDLVPEVVQEMMSGYVQVQVDQQPYMQGFMPVMEAYLNKTVRLAPTDINTGKALDLSFRGQGDPGPS